MLIKYFVNYDIIIIMWRISKNEQDIETYYCYDKRTPAVLEYIFYFTGAGYSLTFQKHLTLCYTIFLQITRYLTTTLGFIKSFNLDFFFWYLFRNCFFFNYCTKEQIISFSITIDKTRMPLLISSNVQKVIQNKRCNLL